MGQDERDEPSGQDDEREARDDASDASDEATAEEAQPLARVRYGLGKELQLYPDSIVVLRREEAGADHFALREIRRLILTPGDPNPSKLVLMFEMDDGATVIVAEGMSSVADFRVLLRKLQQVAPQIELDPPNMDEQLGQALTIRRRSLLGCYGSIIGACLLAYIAYLALAFFGAHVGH